MKFLVLVAFAILAVCSVGGQSIPTKKCPPGEHSVLYCPRMDEPSCDNPTVHKRATPGACDIPDCFCDSPNVRNLKTGKCVKLGNC